LGLCATGQSSKFGDAGSNDYECRRRLCKRATKLAARLQSLGGVDALACSNHSQRYGAVASLARRLSSRHTLARGGPFFLQLDRPESGPLPESNFRCRISSLISAAHGRLLFQARIASTRISWRPGRLPSGTLLCAA